MNTDTPTTDSVAVDFPDMLVGQIVAERATRAGVLEKWGIDYCCGGKRTLAQACATAGLDAAVVAGDLKVSDQAVRPDSEVLWSSTPLAELADHIVTSHHEYLRQELPRLAFLMEKVKNAHGEKHPELHEVNQIFLEFCIEIDSHTQKEERILFPLIKQLEAAESLPQFHCGSILNPIGVMEEEHQHAGDALARIRELTNNFTPPSDTCSTHRVLLHALADLEADLHQHVHKENNILFPRALALEENLRSRQTPSL